MIRKSWLVVCCLGWLWMSSGAAAQAEDPARAASARALFEDGVALADKGQWLDAADRFRRALVLRDSQVIRFNLATALIETGKLIEATELLRQVDRDEAADRKLRDDAHSHLQSAQRRLGKLTVTATGLHEGVTLLLDDRPLDPVQIGVAMPADPGAHRVRAVRQGEELEMREVSLGEGESAIVSLELDGGGVASPAEAAATVVTPQAAPLRDDGGEGKRRKLLGWSLGGGAVVVAAAVVATLLLVKKPKSETREPYQGDFEPGSITVQVGR
jgi:hypothetical protein